MHKITMARTIKPMKASINAEKEHKKIMHYSTGLKTLLTPPLIDGLLESQRLRDTSTRMRSKEWTF